MTYPRDNTELSLTEHRLSEGPGRNMIEGLRHTAHNREHWPSQAEGPVTVKSSRQPINTEGLCRTIPRGFAKHNRGSCKDCLLWLACAHMHTQTSRHAWYEHRTHTTQSLCKQDTHASPRRLLGIHDLSFPRQRCARGTLQTSHKCSRRDRATTASPKLMGRHN